MLILRNLLDDDLVGLDVFKDNPEFVFSIGCGQLLFGTDSRAAFSLHVLIHHVYSLPYYLSFCELTVEIIVI